MAWGQLYYTSCESGLSPYAGFQFNAATPGISVEVMRAAEGLTSYEPPRSLGYHPEPAAIEASPVNLVYRPGPAGVLANVRFVGEDFSHRTGNYFAHSLVALQGDLDLGDALAIEFWGSRFWVSTPVSDTELPSLAALPERGTVNRAAVQRLVGQGQDAELAARLLTAAHEAVAQERRALILVVPEVSVAVRWIAVLSYLLPPETAQRMAFMTYHRRPDQVRSHVVGTLPESDLELSEAAFRDNLLFDLCSGRTSEVEPHPAATVAAEAGVGGSEQLWAQARSWFPAEPTSLQDWHPALAVSALTRGRPLVATDLDPVCAWLPEYGARVGPDVVRQVLNSILEHPDLRSEHLRPLAEAGRRGEVADETLTRVERRAADSELSHIGSGAEPLTIGVGLTTRGAKEFATQRCTELLARAKDVATALALLEWAGNSVPQDLPPAAVLSACAHDLLGPDLLARPEGHVLDVLVGHPALMDGALTLFDQVSRQDPGRVQTLMSLGLPEAALRAGTVLPDGLRWMVIVEIGRDTDVRRHERIVDELVRRPDLAPQVLAALWPQGRWPVPEAIALVTHLPDPVFVTEPWSAWLSRTFLSPDGASVQDFRRLVAVVYERALVRSLNRDAEDAVRAFHATEEAVAVAGYDDARLTDHLRELARVHASGTPMQRALLEDALPDLTDRLVWLQAASGAPLPALPEPVLLAYRKRCQSRLDTAGDTAVETAIRAFMLYARTGRRGDDFLRPVLSAALRKWAGRQINQLEKELRRRDPGAGARLFAGFRSAELSGVLSQVIRRLGIRR